MNQVNAPSLALSNIEFLCLKMHSNPGMPGRWYLRALHQYRFGTPGDGSWNAIYLSPSGGYRRKYFWDVAPKTRRSRGWRTKEQSTRGEFRLLPAGTVVAIGAAAKIGLKL